MKPNLTNREGEMKKPSEKEDDLISKPSGVWAIYPDPTATHLRERWWHKLMFWKKFRYQMWAQKRHYKSLKDFVDDNSMPAGSYKYKYFKEKSKRLTPHQ